MTLGLLRHGDLPISRTPFKQPVRPVVSDFRGARLRVMMDWKAASMLPRVGRGTGSFRRMPITETRSGLGTLVGMLRQE